MWVIRRPTGDSVGGGLGDDSAATYLDILPATETHPTWPDHWSARPLPLNTGTIVFDVLPTTYRFLWVPSAPAGPCWFRLGIKITDASGVVAYAPSYLDLSTPEVTGDRAGADDGPEWASYLSNPPETYNLPPGGGLGAGPFIFSLYVTSPGPDLLYAQGLLRLHDWWIEGDIPDVRINQQLQRRDGLGRGGVPLARGNATRQTSNQARVTY